MATVKKSVVKKGVSHRMAKPMARPAAVQQQAPQGPVGGAPSPMMKKGGKLSKGKKAVKAAAKGMKKKAMMAKSPVPAMKKGGKITTKKKK